MSISHNLKQRHARPVVINQCLPVFDGRLGCVLLHLNPLDSHSTLFILGIVKVEVAILHDWVVFLCDLVTLWQVRVDVVFPIELNL